MFIYVVIFISFCVFIDIKFIIFFVVDFDCDLLFNMRVWEIRDNLYYFIIFVDEIDIFYFINI